MNIANKAFKTTPSRKRLTVMIVHPPKYEGQCEDPSWIFYHKLGQVGSFILLCIICFQTMFRCLR